jgi:hypothetical protein
VYKNIVRNTRGERDHFGQVGVKEDNFKMNLKDINLESEEQIALGLE